MKNHTCHVSAMLLLSLTASAELRWLETPTAHELMSHTEKTTLINKSQDPVVFNQSLLGEDMPTYRNQGHQAESKEYWLDVNAGELAKGVELPVTADLAVIRISPLAGNAQQKSIAPGQVQLSQLGKAVAAEVFVTGEQLKATGMPASDQTVALKVPVIPGLLNLKMSGLGQSAGYVIHVLEPHSEQVMTLSTSHKAFASGQDVVVRASLSGTQKNQPMQIQGYITQPNGEPVANLNFKADQSGQYQAVVSGLQGQSLANGLWEIHSVSEAMIKGQKVLRDVSTAFAVNLPSARFNGELKMDQQLIRLGIDNAMPARYGISAVLAGYNSAGEKQPIALLMSAQWLDAGKASLAFEWPADLVSESGLQGPFVVEQLSLKNQSVLAPVQTVAAGFVVADLTKELKDMR